MATGAAWAQTPEVPLDRVQTAPGVYAKAAKPAKTGHKTPVLAPHPGGKIKQPVHPAAPLKAAGIAAGVAAAAGAAHAAHGPAAAAPAKPAPPAKPPVPANIGTVTGLTLPRYVTLKTDEVNMRAGPNQRFPIKWTYQRAGLPVKIEREFDVWRLVSDMDGEKGWVHQATLNGRRGFVVIGTEPRELRATASEDADAIAILKPGVVGRLRSCAANAAWCEVEVSGYRGFLRRDWFWGSDPNEVVQP